MFFHHSYPFNHLVAYCETPWGGTKPVFWDDCSKNTRLHSKHTRLVEVNSLQGIYTCSSHTDATTHPIPANLHELKRFSIRFTLSWTEFCTSHTCRAGVYLGLSIREMLSRQLGCDQLHQKLSAG